MTKESPKIAHNHTLAMTYEDKETIDEIKAELEETRDLLKDKIITK